FPLILNFGATELALPVALVWRRFAAQRDLARQWILQWPEHTPLQDSNDNFLANIQKDGTRFVSPSFGFAIGWNYWFN
ncbi:hypothetical protein Q604_UNBC09391G0001, partial [human gut metagenome]